MLFSSPWSSITSGCDSSIEIVSVVVVGLFEESFHLSFIFFHCSSEFSHLVVEKSVKGVSSCLDNFCHLGVVGSYIIDEFLSEGSEEIEEGSSLSFIEISFLSLSSCKFGIKSSIGLSNSLVNSGLLLFKESEESESVV